MNGARDSLGRAGARQIWLVTFADLLALLITFFVLLFAMSSVKHQAWDALVSALQQQLRPLLPWSEQALRFDRTVPRVEEPRAADLDYLNGVLAEKFAADPVLAQALLRRQDDRLVVSLPGDLLFRSGSDRLSESGEAAAAALADALKVVGNRVALVGHTDRKPVAPDSGYASNWELSLARAIALANAMTAAGYPHQPDAIGMADSRYYDLDRALPLAARNRLARRVDLMIAETRANGGGDDR